MRSNQEYLCSIDIFIAFSKLYNLFIKYYLPLKVYKIHNKLIYFGQTKCILFIFPNFFYYNDANCRLILALRLYAAIHAIHNAALHSYPRMNN